MFSSYAGSGGGGPPDDRITGNDLASVSFYEVKLAKEIIGRQLLNDAYLSELRENFMCNLYLDASLAKCPPQIFGRVINLYPDDSDNYYERPVELVTMRVPRLSEPSSILDIPTKIVQNYPALSSQYIRIPIWATTSDMADLEESMEEFWKMGVYLDRRTDFEELQELNSVRPKDSVFLPWIIIVTSDWLSAQTALAYQSVFPNLKLLLIEHGRSVINYHPRPGIILNEVAEYIPGRTRNYFLDAYSVPSLLSIVDDELNAFLNRPLNSY